MSTAIDPAVDRVGPETALAVNPHVVASSDEGRIEVPAPRPFVGARSEIPAAPPTRAVGARLRLQDGLLVASLALIGALAACALFPDAIAPCRAGEMSPDAILAAPLTAGHVLGTDQFGRDVLSLIVFGARQSLLLASLATLVSVATGVLLGLMAGYAGGLLDMLLMRLVDIWLAVPAVLLGIAICTALNPSLPTLIAAVTAALAPRYARVVRGEALSLRSRGFVEAARVGGVSHISIVLKHVLPHCAGPILVMATLGAGWSILIGSALSFLGFGVNGDRPDWAYLISEGRGYLTTAWWTVTFPGVAIGAFVVSTNLLGDALRRRLDPRGLGQ